MRALRTFHCLTPVSPLPLAPAVSLVVCFGGCFCFGLLFVLWVVFVCLVLQVSGGFSPFLRELDLDDRQCFTARSAALKKKGKSAGDWHGDRAVYTLETRLGSA